MQKVVFDKESIPPSKVICISRNYVAHIEELGNEIPENMVIFNKPNSAITQTLHYFDPACRFEGEICLIIKESKIAGLGLGLDLTHAQLQNRLKQKGLPWERAKAFDGSAVLSEFIAFEGELQDIHFKLYHNGTLVQHADYTLMMYKPHEMMEEIRKFMTLEDYDIIMTGTPKGVGTYQKGDLFEMKLYEKETLILISTWKAK
jgi:2-keto-4-pentenoate hydratase/2-oxohepta-3-ene-1,7-dioic acid hydratase in catechol pathway